MLGEIRRNTQHVFRGPCEDVSILTEEIDKLAFLFAVKVGSYKSKPLRVVGSKGIFFVILAGWKKP